MNWEWRGSGVVVCQLNWACVCVCVTPRFQGLSAAGGQRGLAKLCSTELFAMVLRSGNRSVYLHNFGIPAGDAEAATCCSRPIYQFLQVQVVAH